MRELHSSRALLTLPGRPRRRDAIHPRVGDGLPHVLVVVNEDAQKDVAYRHILFEKLRLLLPIGALVRGPNRLERLSQELDDGRLVRGALLRLLAKRG